MKFIAAVTALIFAGLAAITLAPKLAFSQVLPLPGVTANNGDAFGGSPEATRVFGHHFKGPIRHLNKAMKPSPFGHAGYEPKHIVVAPGAGTETANPADSNMMAPPATAEKPAV